MLSASAEMSEHSSDGKASGETLSPPNKAALGRSDLQSREVRWFWGRELGCPAPSALSPPAPIHKDLSAGHGVVGVLHEVATRDGSSRPHLVEGAECGQYVHENAVAVEDL